MIGFGTLERPLGPELTPGPTGESWEVASPWGGGTGGPGRKHTGQGGDRQPWQNPGLSKPQLIRA